MMCVYLCSSVPQAVVSIVCDPTILNRNQTVLDEIQRMTITQRILPFLPPRRPSATMRRKRSISQNSGRLLLLLASSSRGRCMQMSSVATATDIPNTRAVPIWYDSTNHHHRDFALYHPEQPERITACLQALRQESFVELIDIAAQPRPLFTTAKGEDNESTVARLSLEPFSEEELEHTRNVLLQTHAPELVTGLERKCQEAHKRLLQEDGENNMSTTSSLVRPMQRIDEDTYLTTESWNVVLRATAAWMRAVDRALVRSGRPTFALTRPPGHHATRDNSNGFCLVNFAAAAALHAVLFRKKRVSILDWDVHYGQGVANIVAKHTHIRFASIHQVPAFPYMGQSKQVEHGNVLTLPMPPDTTWTCGYEDLFDEALDFCYNDEEWVPDLVIVSAGYDALSSDELASCGLNAADFGRMTRKLRQHLPSHTAIMFGLEGGYQLNNVGATGDLPQAVVETVRAMSE